MSLDVKAGVIRRQILTFKDGPRAERDKKLFFFT